MVAIARLDEVCFRICVDKVYERRQRIIQQKREENGNNYEYMYVWSFCAIKHTNMLQLDNLRGLLIELSTRSTSHRGISCQCPIYVMCFVYRGKKNIVLHVNVAEANILLNNP